MRNLAVLFATTMLVMTGCGDDDIDEGPIAGELPGVTFTTTLSPAEEVPRCAAAGQYANATGAAVVTVSDDASAITLDRLTFSGLSSSTTAAHIHFGQPGVAGPIVLPLGDNPVSPVGPITFTAADYPVPVPAGAPSSFAGFVDAMIAGDTYINVHTTSCLDGEIRGQLL